MQDSTVMPQAQPSQQSSIQSSVPAPMPASPSMPQAQAAPSSYPTQPSYPQAAPQVADPWQEAYQRLSASLSAPQQFQPQAQPWQATPQAAASPAYSLSAVPNYPQGFSSATPISQPQAMPAYSPSLQSGWAAAQPSAPADEYLGNVSDESLEVLKHFGGEAPALLNRYACTIEDALLDQARQSTQALEQLQLLQRNLGQLEVALGATLEDNHAYNLLLTHPDLLADYVNEYFGPSGPVPVETSRDRLQAEVAAAEGRPAVQLAPAQYQRPQLEMPSPGFQQGGAGDFWSTFDEVSRTRPDQLWRVLSQATPEVIRSKMLVSEDAPV